MKTMQSLTNWIISLFSKWLLKKEPPRRSYLCDFDRICAEIRLADVLLIEGRSRGSRIIKQVTQSPWSHAALYIGQLNDIENPELREFVKKQCDCFAPRQLIIESELGAGTIISPLNKYQDDHVRIVRPNGLSQRDTQTVIAYAIGRLGTQYNIRHLLDLARFLFPWALFPRKWRSSLFQHNALKPTQDICSTMIADAFQSVKFPILPLVRQDDKKNIELVRRNPRLFTPSDFDYSPFFAIIKYPIFQVGATFPYQNLPWKKGVISDDAGTTLTPIEEILKSTEITKENKKKKLPHNKSSKPGSNNE